VQEEEPEPEWHPSGRAPSRGRKAGVEYAAFQCNQYKSHPVLFGEAFSAAGTETSWTTKQHAEALVAAEKVTHALVQDARAWKLKLEFMAPRSAGSPVALSIQQVYKNLEDGVYGNVGGFRLREWFYDVVHVMSNYFATTPRGADADYDHYDRLYESVIRAMAKHALVAGGAIVADEARDAAWTAAQKAEAAHGAVFVRDVDAGTYVGAVGVGDDGMPALDRSPLARATRDMLFRTWWLTLSRVEQAEYKQVMMGIIEEYIEFALTLLRPAEVDGIFEREMIKPTELWETDLSAPCP